MTLPPLNFEVDTVDHSQWVQLMRQFDDASLYQTPSYAMESHPDSTLSRLLLKQADEVVACCQLRLRRLPVFNLQVADVWWGPMCVRKGQPPQSGVLSAFIMALKEEYGVKRGCFLRISTHAMSERKEQLLDILKKEGFTENRSERPYRTLMLDLAPPLDELRNNLLKKWRNSLNKAEKNELVVIEGSEDELFEKFVHLAAEMRERKKLASNDHSGYRRIQKDLPDHLKLKIMVCEKAGEPVAAVVCTAVGNTGIYLLGASGPAGRDLNASYLLQWRLIEWMKSSGIRYYDLGAINPDLNPSVYHFKLGVVGKSGWDETFLRVHEAGFSWRGRLAGLILNVAKKIPG